LTSPRLLLISPDFPPERGGIQTMADRLSRAMGGFETTVVTPDSAGAESFDRASGLATTRTAVPWGSRRAGLVALNARAVREGVSIRPHVTLNLHIVASPAAALLRRRVHAPTVQYFHANEIADKRRLALFAAARADAVIAVSTYCRALLADAGAATERVRLIPPGVDLPSQTGADWRSVPDRELHPTVLTIARLEGRYKGHDVLARALVAVRERVADVRWVVIGEGSLRGELEAQVRSLGLGDAVSFLGAVSDRLRDEWLARCDVFAMPSRLPGEGLAGEGFGMVYLEAAAHGKPVVAGRAAGALDAVLDGQTGLLVDPTEPQAVAGAVAELLSDRPLAARLGAAGAARAREFAWPHIAARVEALLLEQLAGPLGTRRGERPARPDAQAVR
jgi:phosphatidyl-myo-inositol dimannoside synthase